MFSLVATLAFGSFAMANNVELLTVLEVENAEVLEIKNSNLDIFYISKNLYENIEIETESCFSFMHRLYTAYYGGINIDNVQEFNLAVHICQNALER